ncbi:hypothetical protein ACIP5Y_07515 [Nocardia sp. NPDC088792]|uniref:hypothetical protein n=1 Tax=Nocardia sp. NPDC088792 TaxID=3364332 RepID=UPI0038040412
MRYMTRAALLATAALTGVCLATGPATAMTAEVCESFHGVVNITTMLKPPNSAKAEAGAAYCICRHEGDKAIDGMPIWGDWVWVGQPGPSSGGAPIGFYQCVSPTG